MKSTRVPESKWIMDERLRKVFVGCVNAVVKGKDLKELKLWAFVSGIPGQVFHRGRLIGHVLKPVFLAIYILCKSDKGTCNILKFRMS